MRKRTKKTTTKKKPKRVDVSEAYGVLVAGCYVDANIPDDDSSSHVECVKVVAGTDKCVVVEVETGHHVGIPWSAMRFQSGKFFGVED